MLELSDRLRDLVKHRQLRGIEQEAADALDEKDLCIAQLHRDTFQAGLRYLKLLRKMDTKDARIRTLEDALHLISDRIAVPTIEELRDVARAALASKIAP